MDEDRKLLALFPQLQPPNWVTKLICLQADLIYNCLLPVFKPFPVTSESYHQTQTQESRDDNAEWAVYQIPSTITLLLRRFGLGFLSAAYVCMVLLLALLLAVVLGVGFVHLWAEEPVFVREKLHFDYTHPHPMALFSFDINKKRIGVPIGHTFYISLVLVMPESNFNRDIGVFQLSVEVVSENGNVTAKSSQPMMLRYRSFPVRLARTLMMGMPLLLGICEETQKMIVEILKHKEDSRRSKAIKAILSPRAGTTSLPQIYEAEIVMNSQLPGAKQMVHNWKWTFYVWASLYIYIVLLMMLLCWCRPLTVMVIPENLREQGSTREVAEESADPRREWDENEASELLMRRWQRSRSKRKAMLTQGDVAVSSNPVSTAVEDVGDSESVCLG